MRALGVVLAVAALCLVLLPSESVGTEVAVAEKVTKGVSCKVKGQTFICPHDDGVCCEGATVCCPRGYKCAGTASNPKCRRVAKKFTLKKKHKKSPQKKHHKKRPQWRAPDGDRPLARGKSVMVVLRNNNNMMGQQLGKDGVVRNRRVANQNFGIAKYVGFPIMLGVHSPKKGMVLSHSWAMPAGTLRTYAFWVKPLDRQEGWSNIFHFGNTNTERGPGIWFRPNSTQLHIRHSTKSKWNGGVDAAMEGSMGSLPTGEWTHVVVSHGNDLRVYFNGKLASTTTSIEPDPIRFDGPLYFSDPWYPEANVQVRGMRFYFYRRALNDREAKTLFHLSRSGRLRRATRNPF